ncbi:integrin alpha [Phytomonospora sp. NPDC050363]|uniref:integrin alpha n=1 Tax=Phytomonospora sp. NPDC050363 TaxID=3155642 RepID=UPI0033E6118E
MRSPARALGVFIAAAAVLVIPAQSAHAGEHRPDAIHDFDCDGITDTVYDSAFADVGDVPEAGSVYIDYSDGGSVDIDQASPGIPGTPEKWDMFGWTHTSFDDDGDGCDELVVGAPGENDHAGMVFVIPGSPTGLRTAGTVAYNKNSPGVPRTAKAGDDFAWTLSAGRTVSSGSYLIVGAPNETVRGRTEAGAVYYLRGGTWRVVDQDTPGVTGAPEIFGNYGLALASSDRHFAVGAWQSGEGGTVTVFNHTIVDGAPDPLTTVTQDTAGISGTAEYDDKFGFAVSVISYRPSASAPIGALVAVGVPGEDLDGREDAGMAHILAVTPAGKVTEVADVQQNTAGVTGTAETGDEFGGDVVLGVRDGAATATPTTAILATTAYREITDGEHLGAVQVFGSIRSPGDGDAWLPNGSGPWSSLATTGTGLVLGMWGQFNDRELPWHSILA